jgi:hypothetical protein
MNMPNTLEDSVPVDESFMNAILKDVPTEGGGWGQMSDYLLPESYTEPGKREC